MDYEDAKTYVFDNAADMLVIEFPHDVAIPQAVAEEIDRRLEEFVKREVLPLLRDGGVDFPEENVNNLRVPSPVYTYVMFRVK